VRMETLLLKFDPRSRGTKPRRFALGAAWGVAASFGAWLIGTLNHADRTGLGITWPVAVALVLIMGLIPMFSPYKKK
jgi:hypothetical protein